MVHITPLGLLIVTWKGIWILGAFCLVLGIIGSLVVPLFLHLLEHTKVAKARRAREYPAEAQRRIGELSARLVQEQDRSVKLEQENAELRRLNLERHQFNRDHDARVSAAMERKVQ